MDNVAEREAKGEGEGADDKKEDEVGGAALHLAGRPASAGLPDLDPYSGP